MWRNSLPSCARSRTTISRLSWRPLRASYTAATTRNLDKDSSESNGTNISEPNTRRSRLQLLTNNLRPYYMLARADKPIGTALLYIPCTWSILMASKAHEFPLTASTWIEASKMLALFGVGALIMRGAGCTINDLWDKDFDGQVQRTRDRPLASGQLSKRQAIAFLGLQLSTGLAVLTQLNWYSIALGTSSMALVITYPLAKRFTDFPQAVLGLTFNWGALLGWSAVCGTLPTESWSAMAVPLSLYGGGVAWTLFYDTIYAHQDKQDDAQIGVRSTALRFADRSKWYLGVFSAASASLWLTAGYLNQHSWLYYFGVALSAAHMVHTLRTVDLNRPQSCGLAFRRSQLAGWLLTAGIAADMAMSTPIYL